LLKIVYHPYRQKNLESLIKILKWSIEHSIKHSQKSL